MSTLPTSKKELRDAIRKLNEDIEYMSIISQTQNDIDLINAHKKFLARMQARLESEDS